MTTQALNGQAPRAKPLAIAAGVLVLCAPVAILVVAMLRYSGSPQPILAGGIATSAFLALGLIHQVGAARALSHKSASPLYLIAVLMLWMSARDYNNWFMQSAMGALLGIPLMLFLFQEFLFTSGGSLRRARYLVRRLANRTTWPSDLAECKALPEVKALREALREDAEPVMVLLMNPRPEVRIAALASLEFRPAWRKGQAETVLQAAKFATEPPVRAAALMALANVDDLNMAPAIAIYLRDAAVEVRMAAAEALLWDAERRWVHIRRQLRSVLADPRCSRDGPLPSTSGLPNQAITDLTMWSGEVGPIGYRSALTLLSHYRRELNENPSPEVVLEISKRAADKDVPSALRVEVANLLVEQDCLEPAFWRNLLAPGQPSALKLLAAGALLRSGPDDDALEALREVALTPNREIALQVAAIVQKCLRVDMGLPLDAPLPESTSKLAAEIARRVIDWANGKTPVPTPDPTPRRNRLTAMARQMTRPTGENPRRRN